MNYQSFASYDNKPPYYHKERDAYYDKGQGVPKLNKNNMTIQDIYRTPFLFIQEHKTDYAGMADLALKGIQSQSPLSKMYFSDKNIKRVQELIKKGIYKRTGGKYKLDTDQEPADVLIAMRAAYMEHARYLPGQIIRQCKRLNQKVVEDIVPDMITMIKQYYGYLKDINGPRHILPREINVNNSGRKLLPSITQTFF